MKTQLANNCGYISSDISRQINALQSSDEYFDFLQENGYLTYMFYGLLSLIADVLKDQELFDSTEEYNSSYKRFLKVPSIQELMQVFIHDPSLCPTAIIGLPVIVYELKCSWNERSMLTWHEYYHRRFLWASYTSLVEEEKKCIRLKYAVLPCVYDDVVKDVHDECVIAELKEINITVIALAHFTKVTERVEMHETTCTLVSVIVF